MMHANLGYMVYNNHSLSSGSTLRVGKLLTVNSPRTVYIYTSHGYSLRAATTGEWCPFEKNTLFDFELHVCKGYRHHSNVS